MGCPPRIYAENLFYGGDFKKNRVPSVGYHPTDPGIRPWYAEKITSPEDVVRIMRDHIDMKIWTGSTSSVLYLSIKITLMRSIRKCWAYHTQVQPARCLNRDTDIFRRDNFSPQSSERRSHPQSEDIEITEDWLSRKRSGIEVPIHLVIGLSRISLKAQQM